MNNEIQEEIEVLQSIYAEDFLSQVPPPQEKKGKQQQSNVIASFSIRIKKEYCSVSLLFTLPKGYPAKSTAQFSIAASHNLSNASLAEINSKLREAKKKLTVGQVQCFELCNVALEHLDLYNKKPESLYESMIKREVREKTTLDQLRTSQLPPPSIAPLDIATTDKRRTESFGGNSYDEKTSDGMVDDSAYDDDDNDDDEWQMDIDIPDQWRQQVEKLEHFKQEEKAKLLQAAVLQQDDDDDGSVSEDSYALPDSTTGKGDVEGNVKRGRYATEFEELTLLGKGASGEVWKVRNRLDRRTYAVKKIAMRVDASVERGVVVRAFDQRIRREVTTISQLLHHNIVRYYGSWIEEPPGEASNVDDNLSSSSNILDLATSYAAGSGSDSDDSDSDSSADEESSSSVTGNGIHTQRGGMKQRPLGKFYDSSDSDSTDSNVGIQPPDKKCLMESRCESEFNLLRFEHSQPQEPSGESSSRVDDTTATTLSKKYKMSTLFIQMEFCISTLRALIDETELYKRPSDIYLLLRQMLEALAYIHSRSCIHRDLKPPNVFLDASGNVKLGDFGLAKLVSRSRAATSSGGPVDDSINAGAPSDSFDGPGATDDLAVLSHSHSVASLSGVSDTTGAVGTLLYSAPEQALSSSFRIQHRGHHVERAGSAKVRAALARRFDDRMDMYALGIILFEMCMPRFKTGMERLFVLRALRETSMSMTSLTAASTPIAAAAASSSSKPTSQFPSGMFPAEFPTAEAFVNVKRIIAALLRPDPSERPSAAELLSSQLLPAKADTDSLYLSEILSSIWRPQSDASAAIISCLFRSDNNSSRKNLPLQLSDAKSLDQWPYDHHELSSLMSGMKPRIPAGAGKDKKKTSVTHQLVLSVLKKLFVQVCEVCGAIEYVPMTFLQLRQSEAVKIVADRQPQSSNSLVAEFLEPQVGLIVSLPSDLISPFARVAALLNLKCLPRYQLNHVFSSRSSVESAMVTAESRQRGSVAGKGHTSSTSPMAMATTPLGTGFGEHPQEQLQAVFHIAGYRTKHSVLDAAVDVVTTCLTFLTPLRPLLPPLSLRLSHPSLLDALLEIVAWDVADVAGYDKEGLMRFWSTGSEADTGVEDVSTISTELRIPLVMAKRLQPFFRLISQQGSRVSNGTGSYIAGAPLAFLDAFKKLFYEIDIIVAVKRAAAKAVSSTQAQLFTVEVNGVTSLLSEKRLARFKTVLASFERAQQRLTLLVSSILHAVKGSTPGSPMHFIIDLGCSPDRRALSPFMGREQEQGAGGQLDDAEMGCLYFEIEAYTSNSVSGGKPAALKRRKAGGDFIHGGQFEHLLHACSPQRDTNRLMGVGFSVNIDMLASLIVKNEEKDRMNGLLSFIDSFKPQLVPSTPISTAATSGNSNSNVLETVLKRQLGLIIVRDKDKEKEKKEKAPLSQERVELKVATQASTLFGLPTVVMNLSSTAVSTGSINGICCAVEASYVMLREIGTYVLSVTEGLIQSQMQQQANVLSPTHSKRMLKTVLNALANIPVPVPTTMTTSVSSSSSSNVAAASSICTVFLFSIPDERFDIISYSPTHLRAHLLQI